MDFCATAAFGIPLPDKLVEDMTGLEEKIALTGARFLYVGDAVAGQTYVVLSAGPTVEASNGEIVALDLPPVHPAWAAWIGAATRALGLVGGQDLPEPRWLLFANAT